MSSTDVRARLSDSRWRRRHSAWLLAPILGIGFFSFIGFLYIASRVRSRKLWIAAVIACLLTAGAYLANFLGESTAGGNKTNNLGAGVTLAVWAVLIVYAVTLNRDYLRWRADDNARSSWYDQPQRPDLANAPSKETSHSRARPHEPSTEAEDPSIFGVSRGDYYTSDPAAGSRPSPAPADRPAGPAPGLPLDLNTADASQIVSALALSPESAHQIVATRTKRGAYASLDDLIRTAALQPHEIARLKGRVTFGPADADVPADDVHRSSPGPERRRRGGRTLDY